MKLTPKMELFCQEFPNCNFNGTEAAIKAGYSKKTARQIAASNLTKPVIQGRIKEIVEKRVTKAEVTGEQVIAEICKLAFANMFDYISINEDGDPFVDLSKLTRDQATAIQEVTVDQYSEVSHDDDGNKVGRPVKKIKFKLADKSKNLELLAKYFNLISNNNGENDQKGDTYIAIFRENLERLGVDKVRSVLQALGPRPDGG